jgi:hypothetical protein
MTAVVWDQIGTRFYESGVDRGVLYPPDGNGVPWNGLISVNEVVAGVEGSPIYFDGVKYADDIVPGEFSASLKAYTFPDEFLECEGILEVANGLFVGNQQPLRFGLSYRTMVGNDVDGEEQGYKIHILYNLIATPSEKNYQSLSADSTPTEFEWTITAIPDVIAGFRPSAHLIFDSRKTSPLLLQDIETTLYGNEVDAPTLPSMSTITSFIDSWVIIRITDNYDGTWTASGPDSLITMLDGTTLQITNANAEYSDANTYTIANLTY